MQHSYDVQTTRLPAEDLGRIADHFGAHYDVAARSDIAAPGNSAHVHVLVEGWACKQKLMADGRRQILAFQLPGDVCDLDHLCDPASGIGVTALTDCRVAAIPLDRLKDLCETRPAVRELIWVLLCRAQRAMTEQIVALGRRTSRQRVAYLLCDLLERLQALGLAQDGRFRSPLTQTDMADALGLSTVHVNRTLQGLRECGLIEMRGRSLRVPRHATLRRAADYEGTADGLVRV